MSVKIVTEGAQLKLIYRLQCMKERAEALQTDLEELVEIREDCCNPYTDVITMSAKYITMDGKNITMTS